MSLPETGVGLDESGGPFQPSFSLDDSGARETKALELVLALLLTHCLTSVKVLSCPRPQVPHPFLCAKSFVALKMHSFC